MPVLYPSMVKRDLGGKKGHLRKGEGKRSILHFYLSAIGRKREKPYSFPFRPMRLKNGLRKKGETRKKEKKKKREGRENIRRYLLLRISCEIRRRRRKKKRESNFHLCGKKRSFKRNRGREKKGGRGEH